MGTVQLTLVDQNAVEIGKPTFTYASASTGVTALQKFNDFATQLGLDPAVTTSLFNGDDGGAFFTTNVVPALRVPMNGNFSYSTEAALGLHKAGTTSGTSTNISLTDVSRMYTTTPYPLLLFTYHFAQDSGSFNTKKVVGTNGYVLYARHSHFGGAGTIYDVAIKVTPDGIEFYFERISASGTLPFNVYVLNTTGGTVSYNKITDLFLVGNYDTVTVDFGSRYAPNGTWESADIPLDAVAQMKNGVITWVEAIPANTTALVYASIHAAGSPPNYVVVSKGGALPITQGDAGIGKVAKVKVELSTTLNTQTPTISNLLITVYENIEDKFIQLNFDEMNRFRNVEGDITVAYNPNAGQLLGAGGAVEAFSKVFTPTGLDRLINPGHAETVRLASAGLTLTYTEIFYKNAFNNNPADKVMVQSPTISVTYTQTVFTGV